MRNDLDKGKDIRIVTGRIPELQSIFRGMLDAAQDADSRFVFMLAYDLFALMDMWEGRTDGWYSMNADLVTSMKEKLGKYLERMSEALKKRDYDAMV